MLGDVFQKCVLTIFIWCLLWPRYARVTCRALKDSVESSASSQVFHEEASSPASEESCDDSKIKLSSASSGSVESSDNKVLASDAASCESEMVSAELSETLDASSAESCEENDIKSSSASSGSGSVESSDKKVLSSDATTCESEFVSAELSNTPDASSAETCEENDIKSDSASPESEKTIPNLETKVQPPSIGQELSSFANEAGFDLTDEEITRFKMWPHGTIPYYIDDFSFDKVLRDRLRNFLDYTNGLTGLHFVEMLKPPTDEETRWVFFINRKGKLECESQPMEEFTLTGVQKVVVGYDCLVGRGGPAAAILSLVGVPPMHNAPGRDKYITVNENNIISDKRKLFTALGDRDYIFHGVSYDIKSASHFGWHQYSANGKATIVPKFARRFPNNLDIGSPNEFSSTDILKVRMLYNYISKSKISKGKISECQQLFVPGSNFAEYTPQKPKKIRPRSKPYEYTHGGDGKNADSKYDSEQNESNGSVNDQVSSDGSDDEAAASC